jgi:hypothetical protein
MESLRAHTKMKKKVNTKKKPVLLDLDNENSDTGEDDVVAEKEKQSLEQLDRALSACQKCGPMKACKINKKGEHVCLTFGQCRGWAVALVRSPIFDLCNIYHCSF